ncbi:MAG: hypothetical protein ACSLE8_21700 [Rhodococcus sp. (in: high G+C Gram-positive bacteria)]
MKTSIKAMVAIAGVAGMLAIPGAGIVEAGSGPCNSGVKGCAARLYSGGGSTYQFSTSDSNLNNNYYDEPAPVTDEPVNDHVGSVRGRSTSISRVCGFANSGYSGSVYGQVASNAGWSNTSNIGVSSIFLSNDTDCIL